jgi:ribosomal protein L31E
MVNIRNAIKKKLSTVNISTPKEVVKRIGGRILDKVENKLRIQTNFQRPTQKQLDKFIKVRGVK